jgi:endo-1,4-beta-xylanase
MELKMKKTIALFVATLMIFSIFASTPVFARNYVQNWASDRGNGAANGRITGSNGWVDLTTNLNTGNFSVSWATTRANSGFNNLQGIGWNPGNSTRTVGYNAGAFNHTSGGTGCTYLTFYGWTRNPLIEYYVVDSWVNYGNTTGTQVGTLTSDGGTYRIIWENMVGANIDGNGPFKKVKSVRSTQRTQRQNNTITFANHTNAWRNAGHGLGSNHSYQAMIVEGYNSSGNANVTVW